MITVFYIICIGALMALYFGPSDAQEIEQGRPINHTRNGAIVLVVAACALLVLLAFNAVSGHVSAWCMMWPAILYGSFTPLDRLMLNTSRIPSVNITYMGPHIRGPKDSWYDSLWWGITRRITDQYDTKTGVHHIYSKTSLVSPFAAALAFELTVLAVSGTLYIINA